jgi:hypothetical protein
MRSASTEDGGTWGSTHGYACVRNDVSCRCPYRTA